MANNFIKKLALLVALSFVSFSISAQSIKDIKINEILHVDENTTLGKSGWIELNNTGYSSINVGGCYIAIEKLDVESGNSVYTVKEGASYRIPTSSPNLTTIPPQGYLVIYAGSRSSQGPEFANFDLKNATDVYLVDASGKIFIDQFIIGANVITPDVSIGREVLSYRNMMLMEKNGETVAIEKFIHPTPGAINREIIKITASEEMMVKDPIGYGMAAIAMSVVFSALLLLFFIFKVIGIANQKFEKRKELINRPASANAEVLASSKPDKHLEASGEVLAAIAYALRQYRTDIDNMESNVLTINKVARSYSPWSSKIYGLTQLPNRK